MFGAAYMLVLYRRVIFGEQKNKDAAAMKDLNKIEYVCLVPLVLMVIWLGVYPNYVMDKVSPSIQKLIGQYEMGLKRSPDSLDVVQYSVPLSLAQSGGIK